MNNFETFISSFENNQTPFLSYRKLSQIHSLQKDEFYSYIQNMRSQIKHIPKQSLVLISLEHSLELFVSFFACLSQNLIPAIIAHPSSKIRNDDFLHKINALSNLHKPKAILASKSTIDLIKNPSEVEFIVPTLSQYFGELPSVPSNPEFAQFSSGSTGIPKAIKYSFSQLTPHFEDFHNVLDLKEPPKFISWLPLYHDMGLIACFLFPILNDIPIHLIDPFHWINHPHIMFEDIQTLQSTHTWMPNFAFKHLSLKVKESNYNLSSMKSFASCAEPVDPDILIDFFHNFQHMQISKDSFAITYAMAENIFAMSHNQFNVLSDNWYIKVNQEKFRKNQIEIDPNSAKKIASCGKPLNQTNISFENSFPLVADILIQSPYMVKEYWNQDQLLIDNEFFNTKDLGFIHNQELYVCGRSSDLIISRGINIFPQEIEDFVNMHKDVYPGRVVCIGNFDPKIGTEKVIVLFEKKSSFNEESKELEKQILSSIYQDLGIVIDEIQGYPHQSLLKTSSGKIARLPNLNAYLKQKTKNIHIIGCSHIYSFNESNQLYNQDTCAQNIFLKQIPVVSAQNINQSPRKEEIESYISKLAPTSIVLFYIGEQDIRTYIPYLLRNYNLPLESVIDLIINNYRNFLSKLSHFREDLHYGWIVPPPPGKGLSPHPKFVDSSELTNQCYYHFLDTELHRKNYAAVFHRALQDLNVNIIDIWPTILKSQNTLEIKEHYVMDYSHLQNVKELFEQQIEKTFQTKILPTRNAPTNSKTILVIENVEAEVKSLIQELFQHQVDHTSDLISLLNSLHIVELIQEVSTRYEVDLPSNWMDKSEIETLSKLCNFLLIHRKEEE